MHSNDINAEVPSADHTDGLSEPRKSGRWIEINFPINDSGQYFTIAVFYGVSGASAKASEAHRLNERLLSHAVARALAAEDAPYAILMDGNVTIEDSQVLKTTVRGSHLVNVYADRYPDKASTPTFRSGGIVHELVSGENYTSSIDHVLANFPANYLINDIHYRWDLTNGLDHVPIDVEIN